MKNHVFFKLRLRPADDKELVSNRLPAVIQGVYPLGRQELTLQFCFYPRIAGDSADLDDVALFGRFRLRHRAIAFDFSQGTENNVIIDSFDPGVAARNAQNGFSFFL